MRDMYDMKNNSRRKKNLVKKKKIWGGMANQQEIQIKTINTRMGKEILSINPSILLNQYTEQEKGFFSPKILTTTLNNPIIFHIFSTIDDDAFKNIFGETYTPSYKSALFVVICLQGNSFDNLFKILGITPKFTDIAESFIIKYDNAVIQQGSYYTNKPIYNIEQQIIMGISMKDYLNLSPAQQPFTLNLAAPSTPKVIRDAIMKLLPELERKNFERRVNFPEQPSQIPEGDIMLGGRKPHRKTKKK
jgi:hypothetical protein